MAGKLAVHVSITACGSSTHSTLRANDAYPAAELTDSVSWQLACGVPARRYLAGTLPGGSSHMWTDCGQGEARPIVIVGLCSVRLT